MVKLLGLVETTCSNRQIFVCGDTNRTSARLGLEDSDGTRALVMQLVEQVSAATAQRSPRDSLGAAAGREPTGKRI